MSSYISYIIDGIWEAKQCILMYFIEIFQAFTGRLPEVDDLIANIAGFLVGYLTAQGFLELFDEKNLYCQ